MHRPERAPIIRYAPKKSFFTFGSMSFLDGKAYRLKLDLDRYQVTENKRRGWQDEVKEIPQFSSMNTELTARALIFLDELSENPSREEIKKALNNYTGAKYIGNERKYAKEIIPEKENLLRYVRVILAFRQTQKLRQEEALRALRQGE